MDKLKSTDQVEQKAAPVKKLYVSPKLEALGSFVDLTQEMVQSEQAPPP